MAWRGTSLHATLGVVPDAQFERACKKLGASVRRRRRKLGISQETEAGDQNRYASLLKDRVWRSEHYAPHAHKNRYSFSK